MNVRINWLLEGKIINVHLSGRMSAVDMENAAQTLWNLMEESDAECVHIVGDSSKVDSIPISMSSLSNVLNIVRHPRLGWLVTYSKSNQIKSLLSTTINQLTLVRHRRFDTLEDCLEFLITVDTSLPSVDILMQQIQAST